MASPGSKRAQGVAFPAQTAYHNENIDPITGVDASLRLRGSGEPGSRGSPGHHTKHPAPSGQSPSKKRRPLADITAELAYVDVDQPLDCMRRRVRLFHATGSMGVHGAGTSKEQQQVQPARVRALR